LAKTLTASVWEAATKNLPGSAIISISGEKYWCEDCKKFISNNKASRKHHESGATHQENRRRRLADMKHKEQEQQKEDNDMEREIQRLKREAHKQIYSDLNNQVPIASKEYETLRQENAYGYGYDNTRNYTTPWVYKTDGPLVANPGSVEPVSWSYFDDEMIDAQRRRLYGNRYEQAKSEQEDIESTANEPQPPPRTTPAEKQLTRYNAGIAGEYKVVDPNLYYNEYYRPATEEEPEPEQTNPADPYHYIYQQNYPSNQDTSPSPSTSNPDVINPTSTANKSKNSGKHHRGEDEDSQDEEIWTEKGIDISKERVPEKTLNQAWEEGQNTVAFRKPKKNNNKRNN